MRILIVYAHPESTLSFNAAMRDVARAELVTSGHEVEVSDLYAQGFAAVAGPADFTIPSKSPRFSLAHEQRRAQGRRHYAPDILREQERLLKADLVLLQFPLWWYGPPAILKGWADRVLSYGFAYTDTRLFDTGLLAGKQAIVVTTTGGTRSELDADAGVTGTVEELLRPVSGGILRFVGMSVHPAFVAYAPASLDERGRQRQLADYIDYLRATVPG